MPYDDPILKELGGYFKAEEPGRRERAEAWATAIGLQKVDGLTPSQFLFDTARDHIEGRITQNQARRRIRDYYAQERRVEDAAPYQDVKKEITRLDRGKEEADKVSERIVAVLNDGGFAFTPEYFISIHAKLFKGVLPTAGKIRSVNIRKREWVLKDESVTYGDATTIKQSLVRDFIDEREFDYGGKTPRKIIPHFARFIAQIWQLHPFGEGNTRTTAVFTIKYLRSLGFAVDNEAFRDNAWYFRNALVRANYADYAHDVKREWGYLEAFFRNLLLGEKNEMKSRYLLIGLSEEDKQKIRELTEGGQNKAVRKRLPEKGCQKKVVKKGCQKTAVRIVELLRDNPRLTQNGLALAIGISRQAIQKHLGNLKAAGRLRRVGPDKGGHWEVIS
jgi:fido (protein-threonine AMPylation protein)